MSQRLTCSLSSGRANINYSDPVEIEDRLIDQLVKLLGKKGIELVEDPDARRVDLKIRIVTIEEGNRLLRYLLPFLSPAYIELDAKFSRGEKPFEKSYKQASQVGLFGGSASGMLKVAADRIAKRITADIKKAKM